MPPQVNLAGTGATWSGASALSGGKGYAPCPLGQVHYRVAGDGPGAPFLLIHQTPVGLVEFVDVQRLLARADRRSIASDNPGYGLSDPVVTPITVADLVGNLVSLLDHLGVDRVVVAGHHTGAAIAAAFAARHPARAAAVVLHGAPFYTAEERSARLARPSAQIELKPDGSHFSDQFRAICKYVGPEPENVVGVTWAVIGQFLSAPVSPTYQAIFGNDMAPDLVALRAPTLVLSDRNDVLHDNDLRVAALRPDFSYQEFSAEGSYAVMRYPQRWVGLLLEFARLHGI